jgi:hypothetical protein
MSTSNYDPVFSKRATPSHGGECQFVRVSRLFEACELPGCKVGRYSREWLENLKRAVQP